MADLSFKFRKKAVRDIYLSNDIGRESPFDPFKDRTVTKFMANPDHLTSDGMYFAEKPGRRVQCMVKMNKIAHQPNIRVEKLVEEGGIPATRKEDELLNDKGYVRPNYIRDVSFTTAQRFDNEAPKNHVQLRKMLMEEREEAIKQEQFKNSEKHAYSKPRDIVQVPDFSHAPTFGTPPPKPEYSLLKPGQSKFTQFGFEKSKKETHQHRNASSYFPIIGGDEKKPEEEEEQASDTLNPSHNPLFSSADAQEAWEAKRKETLSKHGMITGNKKELLRAKAIAKRADTAQGIVDFSLLAPREAPMSFQPRGKEMHDLLYQPSFAVTTREVKKCADVRIGKYAPRFVKSTELKDNVDKLLTIENLSRFYKTQCERDRQSAFVTPDQTFEREERLSKLSREHNQATISAQIKPFSPFDDYALHPPTPPKGTLTRKFTKTPDLSNYADRYNEPLGAILGGEKQSREKAAKQALRKEGIL